MKLSYPGFGVASSPRREGVARALHSSSSLNAATSDDEDLSGKLRHAIEGSGDDDDEDSDDFYDQVRIQRLLNLQL
jgi:hypothetical protein